MPSTDAFTQTYSLTQNYCFTGVLSLIGDHAAAFSLPNTKYYQQVQPDPKSNNVVLTFATTNDKCFNGPSSVVDEEEEEANIFM